jgi:hypothetical protein
MFLRVDAPAEQLRILQHVLHGASSLADAETRSDDPAGLLDLVESFREQGLLAGDEASTAEVRRQPVSLHVEGDGPVAAIVARRIAPRASITCGPVTERTVQGADVVLCCAGWLPDSHWQRLDRWCALAGIPWHMSHAEGASFVVGPIALPERGPRYADTRARRLAAAAFPEELRNHWQALESGVPLPPVPLPSPGARMAVASLLVSDLWAWLEGRPPPGAGVQTVVDSRAGTASRHTVRPLPDLGAPTS